MACPANSLNRTYLVTCLPCDRDCIAGHYSNKDTQQCQRQRLSRNELRRFLGMLLGESPFPVASLLSSVILTRPTKGHSYEILLVERMARDGSQFLNAHVFPGGQVDPSDNGNIRRAALRELYEEASLHLRPSSQPYLVIPESVEMNTSQTSFSDFLQSTSSVSAELALIPFSRWITPKMMPKRFDTTFFLALSTPLDHPPEGKVDGQEIRSLAWFTPYDALTQFSNGKITLFPPQWYIYEIGL